MKNTEQTPREKDAAYRVYCREKGLDATSAVSLAMFRRDWPTWSRP